MKFSVSNSEKGFSIIEALVTLVILTVVILMLYELMIGSMKATMFVESRNDLEIFAQRTVNAIQTATMQSRIIHQENPMGQAYRNLLIASDLQWPIYPDSRLPVADPNTSALLDPDTSSETFVGNEMLLVRAMEPVPILYDHDNDGGTTTPEIPFYVDRYRLEFYFLSLNSARNFNRSGSFLDLIHAKGPHFADYFQLSTTFPGLSAAQRTQIAAGLANLVPPGGGPGPLTEMERVRLEIDGPITQAWDPAQDPSAAPPNNAFYDIDGAGNFSAAVVTTLDLKKASMLPEFSKGKISGKMEYSVATNSDTPIGGGRFGPLKIMDQVPLFGYKVINFPAGFEIKIIGPTGARSVWNRLVLCSENLRMGGAGREVDSQESVVISSAREY
jgi:Prokaryotic N-terminal methylation motif